MRNTLNKYLSGRLIKLKITFRSLRYKNFRLFFVGQSISLVGTWIQRIATPWLVYRLTDSAFLLGLVSFVSQIPTFLLAPFAGVLTDRWNQRRILIVTQILAMIQSVALFVLFASGSIKIWQIIVLNVILGCINAFDAPARQAFLVKMVERKEDLGNAIALNSSMVNGARLIGPSIAGILIATTGEGICFLLNAISYLFVLVSLLMMNISPEKLIPARKKVFYELKEGFAYTFGFIPIRYIILLLGLVSLMGMSYTVLMPVFAKQILHGGPHIFGFLMGATGVGALIGAIYMASRSSVKGLLRMLTISSFIFGFGLIAFSLSRFFLLSMALLLITGFGMIMQMNASNTILQTIVDDDKRGRVMSFYTMAFMGTAPFGSLLAGGSAGVIGAPFTVIIGGISCIAGAIIFRTKLEDIRKLIRPVYIRLGIVKESKPNIDSK